ncbi:hypothetical protein [Polyangium fumosum]|uniref:Uncharacterized protein n=1 Tax=Polyangium fumosum TaxID=889272 RepID=A0A4U1JCV7_9BACT|nr:hypothetical protein [Polyangium fumosum]TKD07969.1 hypothetical protein E8A74_16965 [Polyangium fumosum]
MAAVVRVAAGGGKGAARPERESDMSPSCVMESGGALEGAPPTRILKFETYASDRVTFKRFRGQYQQFDINDRIAEV